MTLNTLQPIIIPARAGGIIPVRFDDLTAPVAVWIELCLTVSGRRSLPMPGTLIDVQTDSWSIIIPKTFSDGRYGQDYLAVICWQNVTGGDVYEVVQPIRFGVDNEFDPQELTITQNQAGEVIINVARITLTEFDAPDFTTIFNFSLHA